MSWQIINADCIEAMREMEAESVDAIVTDPPYELGFMGKGWDASGIANSVEMWTQALRVLKPGGHLLSFGGTRTYHRMVCAVEDAGFEIRDQIAWMFGSGFPKSLDVSKAIDKQDAVQERLDRAYEFQAWLRGHLTPQQVNEATGTDMGHHVTTHPTQPSVATADLFDRLRPLLPPVPERIEELVALRTVESQNMKARAVTGSRAGSTAPGFAGDRHRGGVPAEWDETAPHTPEAAQWQGWGTALKPAMEPVVVARKPLIGTVASNVLEHGTGAINVDGCRIDSGADYHELDVTQGATEHVTIGPRSEPSKFQPASGRWPANVVMDDNWEPVLCLSDSVSDDAWKLLSEWCDARNSELPTMRGKNRRAAEPSESPEVLLEGVSRAMAFGKHPGRRAPDEGAQAHPGIGRKDARHTDQEGEAGAGQSELEGGVHGAGLPIRHPAGGEGAPGASAGDGAGAGSATHGGRNGASHQRNQGRQPTGEPGSSLEGGSHAASSRRISGAAAAPRPRREVFLRDVPAHWLTYFEFTGDVVRVGAGRVLDEQTGELTSSLRQPHHDIGRTQQACYGKPSGEQYASTYGDSGGASRFFYCAKTSSAERNAGLDGFEEREHRRYGEQGQGPMPQQTPRTAQVAANVHPTVKPIALMRWLVRMVTPPNGTILDPFNGSGSTGCAAVLENFNYIGIEREAEYVAIAEARIKWWSTHPEGVDMSEGLKADRERKKVADSGQMGMFGEAA